MKSIIMPIIWGKILSFLQIIPSRAVLPENILVFHSLPKKKILEELLDAFIEIYRSPPWNEVWKREKVREKFKKKMENQNSILVVRTSQKGKKIEGFSMGVVGTPKEVILSIEDTLETLPAPKKEKESKRELECLMNLFPEREPVLYWDEIALRISSRGGVEPVRQLTLPVLSFAKEKGAKKILFRSTPKSKIIDLTSLLGFYPVFMKEKIIYCYASLFPVLKFAEMKEKWIRIIMDITSLFLTRR